MYALLALACLLLLAQQKRLTLTGWLDIKSLSVLAIFGTTDRLRISPIVQGTIASEEEDLPVAVEETYSGNYVVVFDPLDGYAARPSSESRVMANAYLCNGPQRACRLIHGCSLLYVLPL